MEEEERTFTPGQAEAMDALLSGRNVFLSGNAGTGKSYVLNAFIEELEEREVPYLAMAPTGIAAQNLHNGTTIHRTLQVGFGVLDPHDENKKRSRARCSTRPRSSSSTRYPCAASTCSSAS